MWPLLRYSADLLHLASFAILIMKIQKGKNCSGISCRTQELYLLVFCCRYWDLFFYFLSLYHIVMKIGFIAATAYVIYLMRKKLPFCLSYDKEADNFDYIKYLLGPCLILGCLTCEKWSLFEISWSSSLWLEAVAFIPQLVMLQRMGEVENMTSHYVGALGAYRGIYLLHWITKYFAGGHISGVQVIAGLIQTFLYADFLYYYIVSLKSGSRVKLPL